MADMIQTLRECRVVPVVAIDSAEAGLEMAEALIGAGLPVAEITFRTAAAESTIKAISSKFPDMLVGAGTVLNTADLQRAVDAGARFAVAPGCNPKVVQKAMDLGFPFFPGVATPSDIEMAIDLGVQALKFFPAEALGGPKLLKSMAAPYKHLGIPFVPTGGINADNMGAWLELPMVAAVGGSWMVKKELLAAGDWETVTRLAAEAVQRAAQHA